MSFLTANWKNLLIINYTINPKILKPYIPTGTELDFYQGKCYISLVGFIFENVKLKGFSIPFHTKFEEVNLRFYVKKQDHESWKRGVVFIKEIVPKPALSLVANTFYKEHYETLPMKHENIETEEKLQIEYNWKKNNQWNSILVETDKNTIEIKENTEAEFITEHYFGYTKYKYKTLEYEVKHPRWKQYIVKQYKINVDFEDTYGNTFAFLQTIQPQSIILAEGSAISVETKKRIL